MKYVTTAEFDNIVYSDKRRAKRVARQGLKADQGDGFYQLAFVNRHNQLVVGQGTPNQWHPRIVAR